MNFSYWNGAGATTASICQLISRSREGTLGVATRRLTNGQFQRGLYGGFCANVGIVYVRPLSVKSNSPEGPLRRVPVRHTVYFLYRAPYYAVAERRRSFFPTAPIDPARHRPGR
jgi:hypothetical protein